MKKSLIIFVLVVFSSSLLLAEITAQSTNAVVVNDLTKFQTRDLLYDQVSNPASEGGITAQDFEDAYNAYDAEGADEFSVPADGWTINQVMILGSYSTTGPCDLANVRFYADDAGMPGDMLFEYLAVAANPDAVGNLDITIPNSYLAEGTYWVSVQGKQDFGTAGQWYWSKQESPTIGEMFYWRNPGDGFASGNTDWVPATTQYPDSTYDDFNLSFSLYGTVGGSSASDYVFEDFESGTFPPTGWTEYQLIDPAGWILTDADAYSPTNCVYHNDDNVDTGIEDWLITPVINFDVANMLTFYETNTYVPSWYVHHGVWVSTGSGNPADGDFVLVSEFDQTAADWTQAMVDLGAYSGEGYIGFKYTGDYASEWYVDDIEVFEATSGTISGMVTDVDTATGIEGAVVTAGSFTATSGADGSYTIENVLAGTYTVTCMAVDYFSDSVADVAVASGDMIVVDFALEELDGDTIDDPIYVDFVGTSYFHSGTTEIYNDDYDTGSTDGCPDVVYEFTIGFDTIVDVSLLGSSFDTKLGIYEAGVVPGTGNYLFYNDDYNGRDVFSAAEKKQQNRALQSAIFDMELTAGTYVAVVDGYGSSGTNFGDYQIAIDFDPVSIYDVQYTDIPGDDNTYPSLMVGETVTVTGIVTATDGVSKHWIQDAEGAWNGVYVYSYDLDSLLAVGDELTITAEVAEYFGLTELQNVTESHINSSGNALPGPVHVATGAATEPYEGVYGQFLVASCTAEANTYGEAMLDDGTGDAKTDDVFYDFEPVLAGIYNVAGVFTYSFDEYKLLPRSMGDIEDITDELLWPPLDLSYVIDESDILLDWVAPTQYGWNTYYPGPQYFNRAAPERATLYDVTEFGFSYPIDLSKVSHTFYDNGEWGEDTDFTFKIYAADGATLLHESAVMTAIHFTEIVYEFDAITMDDNFYVAVAPVVYNETTGQGAPFSLGADTGNNHGYVGEPGAWEPDLEHATSIYINGDGAPLRYATSYNPTNGHKAKNFENTTLLTDVPENYSSQTRALLGFNVYRNDTLLNDELIADLYYDDLGVSEGTYTYYVTAVWHMGESAGSNEVTATLAFGDLEGTVTNSESGEPIAGAVITAGPYGASTDATGYYLIEGMLVGDYNVNCSATTYNAADPVAVEITDGGLAVVDFALIPGGGGDIYFLDDFESGSGNWTLEGTWAVTDEESHSPSNSLHDSPGGNYAANLNISATLATPWDLSGVLNATLSYWYMCDIETAFDYMYAEISTDGETWLNLETYDIQDMTEFVQEEIALGGFVGAGYETVWLRFRLETDGGFEINGMYIDDVLVTTSMEDTAAPFIIHNGPAFYEGTADDYVFTAVINDVSGIAEANVIYTLDEGDAISAPYTSVDGNVYTFTIPAQDAGVQVDYAIEATDASENSNVGMMDGFVYIAGTPFIYDNGIVDFYTTITEGTGAAVRIDNPAGFQLNLAYALIRNYTDQSGQDNDDFEFHVWADNGGVPGADLITPFIVSPEASYTNTSAMTRIDLRPYADDLADIQGNFYIGFLANTGGEYGVVHCTITQPGFWPNSFAFDGTGWAALDGFSDYHFRAVAELIPTAVGTVEGIVTRSDTGDPLEGALVAIGGASDETAADGSYSLITDPGEMSVTVTLDGYNVFNGTVTVVQDDVVEYDVQLSPAFWAPGNLAATYNPPNPNVVLQWDAPAPPTGETVELIYDNDVSTGAYSYEGYSMGTQMSPEQSCQILQLKIHTSAGSGFNAEVWGWDTAPTEDMLYQELVTDVATDDWNTIDISAENLMVDGDFMVTFGSINADTYMSYDTNLDNGRSWDHADTGGWATWGEAYLLRAVVQYGDGRISELSPVTVDPVIPANRSGRSGEKISIDVEDHFVGTTRELTGYNVYRDGIVIGNPSGTFYLDAAVPGGLHEYYITALYEDPTGESSPSNVIEVDVVDAGDPIIPVVTELSGNYPNPFNPVTKIKFAVSEPGVVNIEIYNIKGEKVKTLVDGFREANYYTEEWNGTDDNNNTVSSGVYFYKMKAGRYTSTKKMILMK